MWNRRRVLQIGLGSVGATLLAIFLAQWVAHVSRPNPFMAARADDVDGVRRALDAGWDVNAQDEAGFTPLHGAAAFGSAAAAELLIERGASFAATGYSGSPLHQAAAADQADMVWLLIRHGADPNVRDPAGRTPLDWALTNFRYRSAEALLQAGADPDAPDAQGTTPLHRVARAPDFGQSAVLLLRYGADPSIRNAQGQSAYDLAGEERIRDCQQAATSQP